MQLDPVDLRGDFEKMLEVDIAYISWMARCGATENYLPLINESKFDTTEDVDPLADTPRDHASFISQIPVYL